MKLVNNLIKLPEINKTMQEMSMEMMKVRTELFSERKQKFMFTIFLFLIRLVLSAR
jgi:hypothetical protein